MWILSFFTKSGVPATGLNPTIRIRDVATSALVVTDGAMQETGDGFYAYNFSLYDSTKDYSIVCDGGVTLSNYERYNYGSSGEYISSLNDIESKVDTIDIRSDLIRKIQTNRLELSDGDTSNWILYDDDDVTELLVFSVKDKNSDPIIQQRFTPSIRGKAVES